MGSTAAHQDLVRQIRQLETELTRLWQELGDPTQQLPEQRFAALEVAVGALWYLLPVGPVREVIQVVWPQPLADSPEWVMGSFQYAQQTVPMIDLALRLGDAPTQLQPDLALIVLDTPAWIGLMVSAVRNVVTIDARDLSSPHPGVPQAPFLLGALPGGKGEAVHLLSVRDLANELTGCLA